MDVNVSARIGGPDACEVKPHSKPWMVGLYFNAFAATDQPSNCGGSLIGRKFVLTAAHCICYNKNARECILDEKLKELKKYVSVGDHDVTRRDVGEKKLRVAKLIPHELYSGMNH